MSSPSEQIHSALTGCYFSWTRKLITSDKFKVPNPFSSGSPAVLHQCDKNPGPDRGGVLNGFYDRVPNSACMELFTVGLNPS